MRVLYIGIVAVAVVAAGFGLGALTRNLTGGEAVAAGDRGVDVYDCPAGNRLTDYQPGSRVYAVGKSQSGNWIQVRDLDRPTEHVWMRATDLELDDPGTALPTVGCDTVGFASAAIETTTTVEATTTTTTTTISGTTTTTTAGSTTTTESKPPSTEATTTTTVKPTTTTTTPDTTPPTMTSASAAPIEIYDDFPSTCTGEAKTSEITVVVTDAGSGVASVEASWTVGGDPGSTVLSPSGNTYSGTFGPFPYPTAPANGSVSVDITITATDGAGNQSTTTVKVLVNSADLCVS